MDKTKFLKGELQFKEGSSSIKNFLQTFAKSVIRQDWIPYDKNEQNKAWAFDAKREIWLPEVFPPQNIKIYKARLNEITNVWEKDGSEIDKSKYILIQHIIRGIGEENNDGTQINDRVLIEVTYDKTIFQQITILEKQLPSGEILPYADLKSRPQGDIELYEEEIQRIVGEELYQEGGNEFYLFGKSPISMSQDSSNKVIIKKNGSPVSESEYVIDYWNGIVMFKQLQEPTDKITADYTFKTGKRKGSPIDKSKYKRNQKRIIDITSSKELKDKDYIVDVDYYWELHYPSSVQEITDRIIIKTKVDISNVGDRKKLKEYYVEMKYMNYEEGNADKDYKTGILMRFGSTLKKNELRLKSKEKNIKELGDEITLDDTLSSTWAKFSWYKNNCFEDGVVFEDWLPIKFAVNFTKEYMNIFIQGDPSADYGQYESHYIIGYAYLGMLESYENAKIEDLENNFAMTVSSGEPPLTKITENNQWGVRTGNGVTDVIMEKTASNIPYQGHNVSFHTTPEFMDKIFITSSNFTGCHHFSKVTVVHYHERERGMLQGVLIGDKSAMFHLDEITHNKDEFDLRGALVNGTEVRDRCGFPFQSKETKWLHINNNAPYSFLNNSANAVYGIAIRKE